MEDHVEIHYEGENILYGYIPIIYIILNNMDLKLKIVIKIFNKKTIL